MSCPRCTKKWDDILEYRPNHIGRDRGPIVYWEANGTCTLYPYKSKFEELSLPKLPYTITLEDIQKYLVLV